MSVREFVGGIIAALAIAWGGHAGLTAVTSRLDDHGVKLLAMQTQLSEISSQLQAERTERRTWEEQAAIRRAARDRFQELATIDLQDLGEKTGVHIYTK